MPMGWGPSGGWQPEKPSTPHPWVGDKEKIAQTEAALYLQGSTAQHFKGFGVTAEHTFCGQHLRKRHFRWQAGIKSPVLSEFSVNTTSISGWLSLYGHRNSNFLQVRQRVALQTITEVFLCNKTEGFFLQGWLVRGISAWGNRFTLRKEVLGWGAATQSRTMAEKGVVPSISKSFSSDSTQSILPNGIPKSGTWGKNKKI